MLQHNEREAPPPSRIMGRGGGVSRRVRVVRPDRSSHRAGSSSSRSTIGPIIGKTYGAAALSQRRRETQEQLKTRESRRYHLLHG